MGFGDPSGNYWLGNDLLSQLTANYRYKLRFDLQQRDTGNWYYAEYSTFIVQSEADNYTLQVATSRQIPPVEVTSAAGAVHFTQAAMPPPKSSSAPRSTVD